MKRRGILLAALLLAGCATVRPEAAPAPAVSPKLAGMQYLYGSGEAAAISRQAWNALSSYVADEIKAGRRRGVVLAPGATLDAPRFEDCAGKPPAAVFDVDETVLLNLGTEYDDLTGAPGRPFGPRWDAWEKSKSPAVAPTSGAKAALDELRKLGVTVIFNSNRSAENAAQTAATIDAAGLGPAEYGKTLFLMGDDATGSRKDGRRATIAARWCVIAMGGDQLGDFSDLFNAIPDVQARRAATGLPGIAPLWGHGWFVLPNPVYGSALKGDADAIFPADKRWHAPATASKETH